MSDTLKAKYDQAVSNLVSINEEFERLVYANAELKAEVEQVWEGRRSEQRQIVKLEVEVERLRDALGEIARPKVGPDFDWSELETMKFRDRWRVKYEALARAALRPKPPEDE